MDKTRERISVTFDLREMFYLSIMVLVLSELQWLVQSLPRGTLPVFFLEFSMSHALKEIFSQTD